jgi:acyl-CoA synthetase (AMP-forming)/AMP-acid ligase II
MLGYYELAAETQAALAGGWYHTGDLGAFDADGFLYITGRAREVIRTAGEYVAPPEVEAALAGLPGVVDLAVIGIPDDRWGEIVCAVLVTEDGAGAPTLEAVRAYIGTQLASFKHPRQVLVAASIPRTAATGQIQRTLLRERISTSP